MARLGTSRSYSRCISSSTSRTTRSFWLAATGRLPQAETMPRMMFSVLKGTRVPSRFTTISRSVRSTRS